LCEAVSVNKFSKYARHFQLCSGLGFVLAMIVLEFDCPFSTEWSWQKHDMVHCLLAKSKGV
jgi:hypothetical protein